MTDQLTITALGHKGEGVAEHQGARVFVPLTLPGETVTARIEKDRGQLLDILSPSDRRIAPFCAHFGGCGGCQLQHLERGLYEEFKRDLAATPLRRLGIDTPIGALIDARGEGRRRATLHARREGAGFMALKSHQVHDLDRCPILVKALEPAPAIVRAIGQATGECDVALTATLTGLDVNVRVKRAREDRLLPLLARFGLARLAVNGDVLVQQAAPEIAMGKATVRLPVASFLQATQEAEERLAQLVIEGVGKVKSVADLFCGVGPFALRLAQTAKVLAHDSDKPAIAALAGATRTASGLKPIAAAPRDLFRDPMTRYELETLDAVVIDPPRAGAQAQMTELAASKVKRIVSVSCDPGTFARDAAILLGGGYRLEQVTPVDQFAYSAHLELVGVFSR